MSNDRAGAAAHGRCPVTAFGASFEDLDGESYGLYARARREEPVFYSPQIDCWVVTRYADVREILQGDPEMFSAGNAIELMKPLCPAAIEKAVAYNLVVSPTVVDEDPPGHTGHRQALRR